MAISDRTMKSEVLEMANFIAGGNLMMNNQGEMYAKIASASALLLLSILSRNRASIRILKSVALEMKMIPTGLA